MFRRFIPSWLPRELGPERVRQLNLRIWARPTRQGGWRDPFFALVIDLGEKEFPFFVAQGKIRDLREWVRDLRRGLDALPEIESAVDITVDYDGPTSIGGPCPRDPEAEGRYLRALMVLGYFLATGEEGVLKEIPLRLRWEAEEGKKVDLWYTVSETDQGEARKRLVRFRAMKEG